MHEFTQGSGVKTQTPDVLHLTLNVKTSEWGQKKVHVYLKDWKVPQKPLSAIVFNKNHKSLGVENRKHFKKEDTSKYRAFWHSSLSYGLTPSWMKSPEQSLESQSGAPAADIPAIPTYQFIEERRGLFRTAVDKVSPLPLRNAVSGISQHHMYTRYSHVVESTFGKDRGKYFQMDYQLDQWREMTKDPQTQHWVPVPPSMPAGKAGGSKK